MRRINCIESTMHVHNENAILRYINWSFVFAEMIQCIKIVSSCDSGNKHRQIVKAKVSQFYVGISRQAHTKPH